MAVVIAAPGYPAHPILGRGSNWGGVARYGDFSCRNKEGEGWGGGIGGRVLAVTGWEKDLKTARERAYAGVKSVRFEGRHFRRDIGHRLWEKLFSKSRSGVKIFFIKVR